MEKSDVIKCREFLRITHKATVRDKDTGVYKEVEDLYPIAVEFDNAQACSEERDVVWWDDTNGICYFTMLNNGQVRGANPPMGTHGRPTNAGAFFAIDYGEIQQFRMVVDQEGYEKLAKKAIDAKVKVAFNGKEVTLTDAIVKRGADVIFTQTDTMLNAIKDDAKYTRRPEEVKHK